MKMLGKKKDQKGFTLIELVITIVIIGVLAAVAIPKFQNLTSDAEKGVAAGVGAALASATSVNYSRSKVPNATVCGATDAIGDNGCSYYAINSCTKLAAVAGNLADIPTDFTVVELATPVALNTTGTAVAACQVQTPKGSKVTFSAYGA